MKQRLGGRQMGSSPHEPDRIDGRRPMPPTGAANPSRLRSLPDEAIASRSWFP